MKTKILLVEDEDAIRKFIKINLEREGYEVYEAGTGEEGIEIADSKDIKIVILDVMLPGIDGFKVCEILRKKYKDLGIIMLTAKAEDYDKIMGLQYGTDDYMTKPFNPTELTLRIKSLERRVITENEDNKKNIIESGVFKMDTYSRKFFKNGKELDLTPTEFLIMKTFLENKGRAITREELLNSVWGEEFIGDSKIVDVNIRRLRSKIEGDSADPKYIETVWGLGYRWNDEK